MRVGVIGVDDTPGDHRGHVGTRHIKLHVWNLLIINHLVFWTPVHCYGLRCLDHNHEGKMLRLICEIRVL